MSEPAKKMLTPTELPQIAQEESCDSCKYMRTLANHQEICCRLPPSIPNTFNRSFQQPTVPDSRWCGDYKAAPKPSFTNK